MSVRKLPSGRWRSEAWDAQASAWTPSWQLIEGHPDAPDHVRGTYRTKTEGKDAKTLAAIALRNRRGAMLTVGEWRDRWLSDPLFTEKRPKESTRRHQRERVQEFVDGARDPKTRQRVPSFDARGQRVTGFRDVPLRAVSDLDVARYRAGGKREGTLATLRAMFSDAASATAGRLVTVNPFDGLRIVRSKGNKDKAPPSPQQLAHMLQAARDTCPPSFADYLEFAGLSALRPGELDALAWPQIDFDGGEIDVSVQWSPKVSAFTDPKYGPYTAALVKPAEKLLNEMRARRLESAGGFVFVTNRGHHYTPSTRSHHWNKVRHSVGLGGMTLYLATRHYFGWYAVNVLELDPAVVAEQLGHKDGGRLVEQLYGHPDKGRRRQKIRDAFEARADVLPFEKRGRRGA